MSLYNFLHNLQHKPLHIRRRILVGVSLVIVVGFVALWVGTLKDRLGRQTPLALAPTAQETQEDTAPGPLASIVRGIRVTFSDIETQASAFLYKTEQIVNPQPLNPATPRQEQAHRLPITSN